jgi:hypothetical protein
VVPTVPDLEKNIGRTTIPIAFNMKLAVLTCQDKYQHYKNSINVINIVLTCQDKYQHANSNSINAINMTLTVLTCQDKYEHIKTNKPIKKNLDSLDLVNGIDSLKPPCLRSFVPHSDSYHITIKKKLFL